MVTPKVIVFCQSKFGLKLLDFLAAEYPNHVHTIVTTEPVSALLNRYSWPAECYTSFVEGEDDKLYQKLSAVRADYVLLLWWHKILKGQLLNLAKHHTVNLHPSLLPHGRGRNGNFWSIVEESPFGVSMHTVTAGVDAGEILAQRKISVDWTDTGKSLHARAVECIYELLAENYPKLIAGDLTPSPQDLSQGSFHYARELDAATKIDLDKKYTARTLINLLRARTYPPHPGCRFEEDGRIFEIGVEIREISDEKHRE